MPRPGPWLLLQHICSQLHPAAATRRGRTIRYEYGDIIVAITAHGGDCTLAGRIYAILIGAVLVTNNTRHFGRIAAPLALANWRED